MPVSFDVRFVMPGWLSALPSSVGGMGVEAVESALDIGDVTHGSRGAGKALYRRYRPQTFEEVIGQEHVTEPLMQALRTGRFGHAYLFSGPRGCGKTTSARILARCLNCEQGPTATPCGECASCVALATGGSGSVDVIEIDAASHGGVDDARDLREKASYGPAQSRYKVYIIDEAHMVTPQGFNALLKIVEEPPEHVKFVFATTEPEKVIGTIRSRTHHYPFRLVPPARLQEYLAQLCEAEGIPVEPGVLSFVIRAGGGSVRDSLSVLDQLMAGSTDEGLTYAGAAALLGFTEGELLDATIGALAARDGAAVFRQVDRTIETGQDPRRFVEDLLERLRDLIVVAAVGASGGDISALFRGLPSDQIERMRQQAAAFGPGELSHAADVVNTGLTEMTGATSPRLQLELICARLLLPASAGEHGIVARVDRIERRLDLAGTDPVGPPARDPRQAPAPVRAPEPDRNVPTQAPRGPSPQADGGLGAYGAGGAGGPGGEATARAHSVERPRAAEASETRQLQDGGDAGQLASAPRSAPSADDSAAPQQRPAGGSAGASPGTDTGRRPAPEEIAPQAPQAQEARRAPGGLDTDAIRRSWPDVLAKVFSIRRVTWTFLSEHAQVLDYDGTRLLLGISTRGLAATFRGGQHGEVVRQALIEAIGLDTRVEAIPADEARGGGSGDAGGPRSGGPAGGSPAGGAGGTGAGPAAPGPAGGRRSPGSAPQHSSPAAAPPPTHAYSPGHSPSPVSAPPPAHAPGHSHSPGQSASSAGASPATESQASPAGPATAFAAPLRSPQGEARSPRPAGGRQPEPPRPEADASSSPDAPAAGLEGLRAGAHASRGAERATGWHGGDDAPDWAQVEPPHDDDAWITPAPRDDAPRSAPSRSSSLEETLSSAPSSAPSAARASSAPSGPSAPSASAPAARGAAATALAAPTSVASAPTARPDTDSTGPVGAAARDGDASAPRGPVDAATGGSPRQTPSEGLGSGALAAESPGPAVAERDGSVERHVDGPGASSGIAAFRRARADQARRAQAGLGARSVAGGAGSAASSAHGPGNAGLGAASSDDDVSEDDEVIEDLNAVGQPVIASVLGGVVIGEDTE